MDPISVPYVTFLLWPERFQGAQTLALSSSEILCLT